MFVEIARLPIASTAIWADSIRASRRSVLASSRWLPCSNRLSRTAHRRWTSLPAVTRTNIHGTRSIIREPGNDIVVYGGASFVSSLIQHNLIDEFNFFINPVSIAEGLRAFKGRTSLTLKGSSAYPCGLVVNTYGTT
jgi:dihydrofolate reductase